MRLAGRAEEAVETYRRAVYLAPRDGGLRGNLASALIDLRRLDEALVWIRQARQSHPGDPRLALIEGTAQMLSARPQAALAAYRQVRELTPAGRTTSATIQARFGEGLALLTLGQWREGWAAYEARLETAPFAAFALPPPARRWRGEALEGQWLALLVEQGFGDVLQFARYAPLARARGARVVMQVPGPLTTLLAPLADRVVTPGEALGEAAYFCPMLSLPVAFATTEASVPPAPYLAAPPERLAAWRARLGPARGKRLGLVWAGNPSHPQDAMRSAPEAALAPLLALPGVEAHALQPEARPADPRIAAHPDLGDFADTAALASLMDAVISVDTAVAHLAGALGLPGFVLLGTSADFRWMLERADTPWYPSLRLVRQRRAGDWTEPVASVARALAEDPPWRR